MYIYQGEELVIENSEFLGLEYNSKTTAFIESVEIAKISNCKFSSSYMENTAIDI